MAGDAVVLGSGHLDLGDDGQRRATCRRGDGRRGDEEASIHGRREGVGAGERRRGEHGSLSFAPLLFASALPEIEPDLEEDAIDVYRTNGISPEDFEYGKYDGHHTYFEGQDKKGFWEDVSEWYQEAEPPQGFQALISWAFPPAIILGMAFNVPGEYLYIGAAVFIVVFCVIEMGKPDKPHNFEPEIYMMERSARDKLIADYNSMDIWDFNEKYGRSRSKRLGAKLRCAGGSSQQGWRLWARSTATPRNAC